MPPLHISLRAIRAIPNRIAGKFSADELGRDSSEGLKSEQRGEG